MSLLKAAATLSKNYMKGMGAILKASVGTTQGYEGAGYGRRLGNFRPTQEHINALLARQGGTLTARARHLTTNTPYGVRGKESFRGNVIGTGIFPSWKLKDKELRKQIQKTWTRWTDEADADGLTDFYGLQAMAAGALFDAGECFVRLRPRRMSDGLTVPLQLQLLEPEQFPLHFNATLPNGNRIRSSIEFNRIGKRVAYHALREHPGDIMPDTINPQDTVRIPARSILHLYEPLRPGQIRGQTRMAAAIVKTLLHDIYDDAEIDRKKTAAMFAGFIRRPADSEGTIGEDLEADERGRTNAELSPGVINVLLDGEEIDFSRPQEVGNTYKDFQRHTLLSVAAAMGVPYSKVTGDLLGVSYSSLREGIIEFRRCLEQWQHMVMVFQMCRPVKDRWMDDAVFSKALIIPNYFEDRLDFLDVDWIPDSWQWVDPLKDRQGQSLALSMGVKSLHQAALEEGLDYEDLMDLLQEEAIDQRERGLSFGGSTNTWNVPLQDRDGIKDDPDARDKQEAAELVGTGE